MGTAEQASNEIIHYLPMQLDFLGMTVRMQTLYMSWLACILTIVIVWCITSGSKMIPGRAQVALEMFFDALGGLIESNLGKEGREKLQAYFFTLFLYLFVSNELFRPFCEAVYSVLTAEPHRRNRETRNLGTSSVW